MEPPTVPPGTVVVCSHCGCSNQHYRQTMPPLSEPDFYRCSGCGGIYCALCLARSGSARTVTGPEGSSSMVWRCLNPQCRSQIDALENRIRGVYYTNTDGQDELESEEEEEEDWEEEDEEDEEDEEEDWEDEEDGEDIRETS